MPAHLGFVPPRSAPGVLSWHSQDFHATSLAPDPTHGAMLPLKGAHTTKNKFSLKFLLIQESGNLSQNGTLLGVYFRAEKIHGAEFQSCLHLLRQSLCLLGSDSAYFYCSTSAELTGSAQSSAHCQ